MVSKARVRQRARAVRLRRPRRQARLAHAIARAEQTAGRQTRETIEGSLQVGEMLSSWIHARGPRPTKARSRARHEMKELGRVTPSRLHARTVRIGVGRSMDGQ
eukprot:scaffold139221_cov35-Tisochrysis_lutea.AAC.7